MGGVYRVVRRAGSVFSTFPAASANPSACMKDNVWPAVLITSNQLLHQRTWQNSPVCRRPCMYSMATKQNLSEPFQMLTVISRKAKETKNHHWLLLWLVHIYSFYRTPVIKAEVWDFPVMTEGTRLISYLLYGLFSAIHKKNTIKTPGVIFYIHLRALRLSSSLILKKYLYATFSFSYWKYSCTLSIFSVVFAQARVVLIITQKSRRAEKKKFRMPRHYKKIMLAQQPIRARVLL